MKEVFEKWDIFEELKTEEEIQAFVEASIDEARNDTNPACLAHALGVAAKARELLHTARKEDAAAIPVHGSFIENDDPPLSAFEKVARSLGYHLTVVPLNSNP